MTLPKITPKQLQILQLLYIYRFLNRIQLQTFLHHKDYKTINLWLKDLTEKKYINRIYSDHYLERTKPAIYYLATNGIRQLKQSTPAVRTADVSVADIAQRDSHTNRHLTAKYYQAELHKRYKEAKRSPGFIERSLLIAACCLDLQAASSPELTYKTLTETEYLDPANAYHFLAKLDALRPNLLIVRQSANGATTHYLLESFDPHLPQYRLRTRLSNYITLLTSDEWEADETLPIILLALPNDYNLIYAKQRVRKLLYDHYFEDIPSGLHIRFTTNEQLRQHAVTGKLWEEGRKLHGL